MAVTTPRGKARVTLSSGGAICATLPAAEFGLSVTPQYLTDLIAVDREIKWALNETESAAHPTDPEPFPTRAPRRSHRRRAGRGGRRAERPAKQESRLAHPVRLLTGNVSIPRPAG